MSPEVIPGSHEDFGGDDTKFPGGGNHHHSSNQQWTDALVREVESSTSLATTKPKHIQNDARSGVSIFSTPPEIVLYTNGFGNSQAVRRMRHGYPPESRREADRPLELEVLNKGRRFLISSSEDR